MNIISNLFHCSADNVGDAMCGPGQYLWPELCQSLPISTNKEIQNQVILGGGQIFSQLRAALNRISEVCNKPKPIAWGVGVPIPGHRDDLVLEVASKFKLFGTRNYDWKDRLCFVPCASCLSPHFDEAPAPSREIVFYLHKRKGKTIDIPDGEPIMTNALASPKEAINFIASGETVVTSSYHGVYWAQLLGRRVICIPYNEKFKTFQHAPYLSDGKSWRAGLAVKNTTSPLLEEYRRINLDFAERVMEIWNE